MVALVWIGFAQPLVAQELSPRFYWPAPEGTKIVFVGYSYSFGDVTTDPSLPIFGVDSKINAGLLGYMQTLSLFGRTSNLLVEVPYVSGATVVPSGIWRLVATSPVWAISVSRSRSTCLGPRL